MRIIKEGKKIIGTQQVECPKCNAVLELVASDLTEHPGNGFMIQTTYSYECPCCFRTHHITYDEMNADILFDMEHIKE